MKRQLMGLIIGFVLFSIPWVLAQDTGNIIEPSDETLVNAAANITFPPPVYVVRETVDIRGTVSLPTMRNFFVEFRPLIIDDEDALPSEERPWFPASLPKMEPVIEDILGTWNTFTAPDGLYELRLTINTDSGVPEYVRVSPIRVENDIPPFLETADATPIPTQSAGERATLAPTPTPFTSGPRVVALVDSNVRAGDSTAYDRVGYLFTGDTAAIIGISSFSTGWYYVQLESGRRGFIAPSVVRTEGDLSNLPRINPPPPPTPIPTNTPVPTATPAAVANLIISSVELDPNPPQCNETFTIYITVQNKGTGASTSGGSISVVDKRTSDGTTTETTVGAFPPLEVDQSTVGVIPITVSTYFNESHSLQLRIDSGNAVNETNEDDNSITVVYELGQADC